jgi:hypothetical protein
VRKQEEAKKTIMEEEKQRGLLINFLSKNSNQIELLAETGFVGSEVLTAVMSFGI